MLSRRQKQRRLFTLVTLNCRTRSQIFIWSMKHQFNQSTSCEISRHDETGLFWRPNVIEDIHNVKICRTKDTLPNIRAQLLQYKLLGLR